MTEEDRYNAKIFLKDHKKEGILWLRGAKTTNSREIFYKKWKDPLNILAPRYEAFTVTSAGKKIKKDIILKIETSQLVNGHRGPLQKKNDAYTIDGKPRAATFDEIITQFRQLVDLAEEYDSEFFKTTSADTVEAFPVVDEAEFEL